MASNNISKDAVNITVITVGKAHAPEFSEAIALYTSRIQRFAPVVWRFIPHAGITDPEQAKRIETSAILQAIKPTDTVILLDENGKLWSSVDFSRELERWSVQARGELIFVIGGAYGVDDRLEQRSQAVWALSPLVFPHNLARLIVAEQLYRAFAILNNLPYHHA